MTKEQAQEMVEDLLQACYEYEVLHTGKGKQHYKHLQEMKQKVIEALTNDPRITPTSPA